MALYRTVSPAELIAAVDVFNGTNSLANAY